MQNKIKIFLVGMAVFIGSFFWNENTRASCTCGTASDSSFSTTPTDNLCTSDCMGTPTPTEVNSNWQWTCSGASITICSATKIDVAVVNANCCCEDTTEKRCTSIACGEDCAGATKHETTCSEIPNYATACGGNSTSNSTTTTTTATTTTTTGEGITFPTDTGLPANSGLVKGIITNVANWLLSIVGIVAIIGFVISGIQYFLVATDEKMMETAKKTARASVFGIAVALSGYIVISAVEKILNGTAIF